MKIKRIILWILCTVMALTVIPVTAAAVDAAELGEGDWITYRFATEYPDEGDEYDDTIYKPNAGYEYNDDGFSVIAPDFSNTTPAVSFQSKEKVNLKDGVYLQFRIDEYSYDGGVGADQWIAPVITTEQKAAPGSTAYGGGWLTLIRGNGSGSYSSLPYLTDPAGGGTFRHLGTIKGAVPRDSMGREIYTLSITWNSISQKYRILLNDVEQPGSAETTALLERLSPSGEFYIGVNIMSAVKNGTASCTILKYGTSAATATTPVGTDSRDPEENGFYQAPIIDPDTVPVNNPAILWSPETYTLKDGNNINFAVLNDDTWKAAATNAAVYWEFTAKNDWSYDAVDFPVFGILLKNFRLYDGTVWYCAGDVMSPNNMYRLPFYTDDGEFYGDNGEYVFIPIDLGGLWKGRINCVRLDLYIEDYSSRQFEICFAGVFRSEEEAYSYTESYLIERGLYCDHEYESSVVFPTCTERGYTVHTCTLCGQSYMDAERPAFGHTPSADTACQEDVICLTCKKLLQAMTGHDYVAKAVSPTCTEEGYTTHTCRYCKDSYTDSQTPATGHTPGEPATCVRDQLCVDCGKVLQSTNEHSYADQVTPPTCSDQGFTTQTCTNCGETQKTAFVPAKGHTPGEVAGCVTDQLCTVCGAVMQNAIGHNYIDKTVSPTCEEKGYTEHTCTRCGDTYRDGEVAAKGHTPGDWIVDEEPAVGVEGKRHKACTVCSEQLESVTIPALEEETTVESEKTDQILNCRMVLGWSGMVPLLILLATCFIVRKKSLE